MKPRYLPIALLLLSSTAAQAGVIVGGSSLLDNQGLAQLETWLGQGPLTLTRQFAKTPGSTASQFHSAVDGKGPTFSLLSASEDGGATWRTIGGYNPVSWGSSGNYYNYGPGAFIFNLSTGLRLAQTDIHQTYNYANFGPTFGGGHDIYVDFNLSQGYSNLWSYGDVDNRSLVDGSFHNGTNMLIGNLEVFTVASSSSVPEPAPMALLGIGALAIGAARRRTRTQPQA